MLPVVTALNTLSLQTFDKFKKQRTCHFCYHFISLSRDAGKYESMSEKLHVPYISVYNAMFFFSYSCHKKAPRIIHRCRIEYNFLAL